MFLTQQFNGLPQSECLRPTAIQVYGSFLFHLTLTLTASQVIKEVQ